MPYQHQSGHDAMDAQEPIPSHSMVEHEGHIMHTPDHERRTESSLFRQTKAWFHQQDTPCFITGKRRSQGAKIEIHHFWIEWSLKDAIDWIAFGAWADAVGLRNPQTGEEIGGAFVWSDVDAHPEIFVDSTANCIALDWEAHQDRARGIHHTSFSEWFPQKFPKQGFIFLEALQEGGHA